jgi:uncharacterized protein (TIGR02271 family)
MTINTMSDPNTMTGAPVRGNDGDKLGKIDAIYLDNTTDAPEWAAVKSGLFGTHVTLVPLAQASWDGDTLSVPFDKAALTAAPHHDPDAAISAQDEDELYRHYGVTAGRSATAIDDTAVDGTAADAPASGERRDLTGTPGVQGRDTSGPTTDSAMTRSEEQLRVGTQTREAGRARLRKHVVTEHQQVTVPVSHEEVTLEREPITDTNRGDAYDGPAISEEEHEVTLHAQRPVVATEAVAVERIKLGTETVTETETVGGEVRKEQIEFDSAGDSTDRSTNRS